MTRSIDFFPKTVFMRVSEPGTFPRCKPNIKWVELGVQLVFYCCCHNCYNHKSRPFKLLIKFCPISMTYGRRRISNVHPHNEAFSTRLQSNLFVIFSTLECMEMFIHSLVRRDVNSLISSTI